MHICLYISPLDIHLFISIFAQLEKDCVTCTFSISISHFPFAICISVTVAAAAVFPFSLGQKIKCKANFSLFAWGTWRKNAKIFLQCCSRAELKVHVCVRVWHVACSELDLHMCRANTCPVQRRFSISTCRSSRRRATRIEKETTRSEKKTIVLSAHASRLWNTLPSMWETLAVDKLRHVYMSSVAQLPTGCFALYRVQAAECVTFFNWVTGLALELWFTDWASRH